MSNVRRGVRLRHRDQRHLGRIATGRRTRGGDSLAEPIEAGSEFGPANRVVGVRYRYGDDRLPEDVACGRQAIAARPPTRMCRACRCAPAADRLGEDRGSPVQLRLCAGDVPPKCRALAALRPVGDRTARKLGGPAASDRPSPVQLRAPPGSRSQLPCTHARRSTKSRVVPHRRRPPPPSHENAKKTLADPPTQIDSVSGAADPGQAPFLRKSGTSTSSKSTRRGLPAGAWRGAAPFNGFAAAPSGSAAGLREASAGLYAGAPPSNPAAMTV